MIGDYVAFLHQTVAIYPFMAVTLESAGTHHFDLGHLRRQGAEIMVERLLRHAGLDPELPWRLQVQKKLLCNSETPPLRVVDGPKKWAVYLEGQARRQQ